jgi:hypothetical protein
MSARDEALREVIARAIYESASFYGNDPGKPPWVPGGNSTRQDEARTLADAILAALDAAGLAVVPKEPTLGVLMSMALRRDHALGHIGYYDKPSGEPWETHARRLEAALTEARQQYEEVVGAGFYSVEREQHYAMLAAAAKGGER